MAAPSGGVNCEEFAEFQVMRFSSCGRLVQPFVPRSCFVLWPGRESGQVVGKAGGSELFFLGEPLEVMGARGGLGKRSCSVLGGRWLRSSASFRNAKAELGSCG